MSPQSTCIRRCKVALVAFVRFFTTVSFQMCPQMTCLRRCIVTLVTFVWLFSTVCFQMFLQMACVRGYIVTLVAPIGLFFSLCYISHWKFCITLAFTQIWLSKIKIHHHRRRVTSSSNLVLNWRQRKKFTIRTWIEKRK